MLMGSVGGWLAVVEAAVWFAIFLLIDCLQGIVNYSIAVDGWLLLRCSMVCNLLYGYGGR